jgi:MoxR-like ATPase
MTDEAVGVPDADRETCLDIVERVESAAVVDRGVLLAMLAATLAKGHILIEDVPGTGKTVTARILAVALGLDFSRIQFTPDLLPADVTGSNIYDEHEKEFSFSRGPVFSNIVLADEINRAPPKTQAALLEAMEEGQVSVDGTTYDLPEPFVVIATQNPIEQDGTFRLPEAQRDRFSIKTSFGYPGVDGEMELLDRRADRRTVAPSVDPVVDAERVSDLQESAEVVTVAENVRRYIVELARETRRDDRTEVGVSPRGVQRLFEAARAAAVIGGRTYATPDDVKRLAETTLAHRLVLTTDASVEQVEARQVVRDALETVDVPAVSPDAPEGRPDAESDAPSTGGTEPAAGAGTVAPGEDDSTGQSEPPADSHSAAPGADDADD